MFVVLACSLAACKVGDDGKQGPAGVPCAGCVDSASLAAGAVNSTALGDGVVKTQNIAAHAVTGAQIADQAVATNHFTAGAVDANALAANAVTTAAIADSSITTSKLAPGAVDSNALAAGAVGATQLASGAVLGGNIAAGSVGTTQIGNGAVTSAKIAAQQVSELQLNSQQSAVVSSTVDETVLSRFMRDLGGQTTMRVMMTVNGGMGRGAPAGGSGTLTVLCNGASVYSIGLSGGGIRPEVVISPSFTCAVSSTLDVNVRAASPALPVVIRQINVLHGL